MMDYRIAGFASSVFYFCIYIEIMEEMAVSSLLLKYDTCGETTEKDANTNSRDVITKPMTCTGAFLNLRKNFS
jgi:hypothetical protein